ARGLPPHLRQKPDHDAGAGAAGGGHRRLLARQTQVHGQGSRGDQDFVSGGWTRAGQLSLIPLSPAIFCSVYIGSMVPHDPRLTESALSRRLAAATTRDAMLDAVRGSARAVLMADGVSLVLRDGELCHYAEEDAISPLWKGQRFPMSTCISGWSMLHAET